MTDTRGRRTPAETNKVREGIIPPPRDENRRRPASFLTLSFLLHAAFLVLLAPLIFIPGDAATGDLEVISVTVLVDEGHSDTEPTTSMEETRTPEETVPTTDAPAIDVPAPDGDVHDKRELSGEPNDRENSGGDEVGTNLTGIPGDNPALFRYIARVHTKIEQRKYYPSSSRRMKEEGTVTVSFQLTPAGDLVTLSVSSSSGFPDLDDAALDAVRNASPYPPFPKSLGTALLSLKVPITYELR
ncbi:MAG: energy transducer TonB [Deltaproteobacteria bacterium]|nr:energy transducer TonB [Candidatus Zymogenaceae bacterium]